MSYVYEIFKYLHTDELPTNTQNIHLVAYNINTQARLPFIQFMLHKNHENNCLSFPSIHITNNNINNIKLDIQESIQIELTNIKYKGHTILNDSVYVFINIIEPPANLFMPRNQKYWFCIVDEIVNYKKACNFDILSNVTTFLLSNPDFFLLKDSDSLENIEIPIVAYSGSTFNETEITATFGPSRQSETSMFGANYYFTTYEKSVELGGWSPQKSPEYKFNNLITDTLTGQYIKGGINRYALFCLDQHVIYKPLTNYKIITGCDSIYVGEIQLNENILNDASIWVIKKEDQMVCLSYHLLDKTTLGDTWKKDYTQYFIS